MMDPRQVAERIVGHVNWETEVSGFCKCPGEAMHTNANGRKDCRVNVDGAPTIFCFHASCAGAVAEANQRLRRELGASPWELRLPDGKVLGSERDPEDQFRTWLKLWPACSTVWIGDVYSSGKPEHRTHFRPVAEWYQI